MRATERAIATAIVFLLLVNVGVLIGLAEQERAAATTTAAQHPAAPRFAEVDEPYDWRGEQHALEARRRTVIHERNVARLEAERERRRQEAAQENEQPAEPEQQASTGTVGLGRAAGVVAACESGRRRGNGTAIVGTHNWRARNPNSSASGAFQALSETWRRTMNLPPPASAYPPSVQIDFFRRLWNGGRGWRHWKASEGCWRAMGLNP